MICSKSALSRLGETILRSFTTLAEVCKLRTLNLAKFSHYTALLLHEERLLLVDQFHCVLSGVLQSHDLIPATKALAEERSKWISKWALVAGGS